jgi:hypothetical protein
MTATATRTTEFAPVESTITELWVGYAPKIEKKVIAMNRRLAKLGAPAATVTFGPIVELSETDEATGYTHRWDAFETVTVTGYSAKFAGWTPIASLDHTFVTETGDTEAYVSMFPGAVETDTELPVEFRNVGPLCGHCNTNRLRKTTVVFVSDTGEWLNVGTSCLRDFIGITPATILWLNNSLASFDDDDEYRPPAEAYEPDLTEVLRLAAAVTSIWGFTRSADDGATKWTVTELLGRPNKITREIKNHPEWDAAWAASAETAEGIKTWIADKVEAGNASDYIANASLAIRANRASPRTIGLLVSLPFSYSRAMGELAERNAKAEAGTDSVHVGEVGEKMVIRPVTILRSIKVETMYGVSVRVTGLTEDGNKVTTFGSGETLFRVDTDDIVEWRGTVKAHNSSDEYGDETEFNRVKILDMPSDVDFTRVAKKGDTVRVNLTGWNDYGIDERGDGVVYDEDTKTLWATVVKVGKRDDRFTYSTNARTGFFFGADVEVVDPDSIPAVKISDLELYRSCRNNYSGFDEDALLRNRRRRINEWYEARGIWITDTEIDEIIDTVPAAIERVNASIAERKEAAA